MTTNDSKQQTFTSYILKDLPKGYSIEAREDKRFILTSSSGVEYIATSVSDAVATAILNEKY